ncbi:hypothetical protein OOK31_06125 [Streptomyces sp. NBC_00249]|uniref:hypothetical protein n=1 Tax=Streptomyces sp. NBC_00249 TaxID=2975690 RepID=UPI00225A8FBD|nr:hypothetical protein [Streptomyces sp. NBC_00249]MCX5193469.1 hypothetical protein [Streptomyces sp. NBC_00249]
MIITGTTEELLLAAARNNADWCDAVCRAHGVRGAFTADAWTSVLRTPPLYPDAVSLTPGASAAALADAVDTASPGCSVKDSFAALDLAPAGFEVLFEAQWIHRPAAGAGAAPAADGRLEWSEVATAGELDVWEAAWDGEESTGLFRPALLGEDLVFLAGRVGGGGAVVAGAVVSSGGGVVGVSNLFAHDDADTGEAWAAAVARAGERWPGLPVVGYEGGDDLEAAVRAGFTPLGPLRVWLHTA